MSREFKVRLWDKNDKRMVPWSELLDYIATNGTADGMQSIFNDGQQYTGLKDKNDTEIYEGDITKIEDDWGEPTNHEVKWGGEYPAFELYPGFDLESNNLMSALAGEGGMTVEIIGNIYENPELLHAKTS